MTVQLADQGSIIKTAYDAEGNTVSAEKVDDHTFVLADAASVVRINKGTAATATIPTNASVAFPIGTYIIVLRAGAGTLAVAGDTGVTLTGNGGSVSAGSCLIQTQYASATVIKIGTDEWHVQGDIDTVA